MSLSLIMCSEPEAVDAGVDASGTDAGEADAGGPDAGPYDAGAPPPRDPTWCDDPAMWTEPVVDTIRVNQDSGCKDLPPVTIRHAFPNSYPDRRERWLPRGACWRVIEAPDDSGWSVGDIVSSEGPLEVRLLGQDDPDAITVFEGRVRYDDGGLRRVEPVTFHHPPMQPDRDVEGEPLAVGWNPHGWVSRTRVAGFGVPLDYRADIVAAAAFPGSLLWVEQRPTGRAFVFSKLDGLFEHALPDGAVVRLFQGVPGVLVDDTLWLIDGDAPSAAPITAWVGAVEQIVAHGRRLLARRGDRVFTIGLNGSVSGESSISGLVRLVGGRDVAWAHIGNALVGFHEEATPPLLVSERIVLDPRLGEPHHVTREVVHGSGGWQHHSHPEARGPTFFPMARLSVPLVAWSFGLSYIYEDAGQARTAFTHLIHSCD